MKVSARMGLAYGILLASILLLAATQILAVRRLRALGEEAARSGLSTAMTSLQLVQDTELMAEYAGRFFREGDPEARKQIDQLRDSFNSDLGQLGAEVPPESGGKEVERLSQFWQRFLEDLWKTQSAPQRSEVPTAVAEDLDRLKTQVRTVYQASLDSIEARAEESRRVASRTERFAFVFAAGVLVVGGLSSFLIIRSVSIPLSGLAQGTRAMAEGGQIYRLDTSRNDELAQIAKDFNTITERLKAADRSGQEK